MKKVIYFTGFADEAASSIDDQIKATKELGWSNIESRCIDGVNIHDISEAKFDEVCGKLDVAGVKVNCFGSAIANWATKISDPFENTVEKVKRAIPRMQRLETGLIRIMSYAFPEKGEDVMEKERFRRLREITKMFLDAGITPVHENCMNYGGMSYHHTLKLIENVPGLKLVFDTGNPVFNFDRSKPEPWPYQSSREFYSNVKDHVAYIHIKDAVMEDGKCIYKWPGEGDGDVREILADLIGNGYRGGISIEPHLAAVFHDKEIKADEAEMTRTYIEYGRRLMKIVEKLQQGTRSQKS